MGARSSPGNPCDGQILAGRIEQTTHLLQDLGVKPTTAAVDLGYRGVDHLAPGNVVHCGRYNTVTDQQRRWLTRRDVVNALPRDDDVRKRGGSEFREDDSSVQQSEPSL